MTTQRAERVAQSAGRHAPSAMRSAPEYQTIQAFAERVRADLQDHLRVTRKSQATAAKAIGMSDAVISQFLSKGYKGDVAHVAHSINAWLLLESGRLGILREPIWVETKPAQEIHTAMDLAHKWCDLGMVYGAAGLGKTRTGKEFRRQRGSTVLLMTADETTRSPFAFLVALAHALDVSATATIQKTKDEIAAKLAGSGRLLIVDEAQKLTYKAVETLRAIYDKGGFGLVLLGNEILWRTFTAGRTRSEYDQLVSRVGIKRVIQPGLEHDDVARIAVQYLGHRDPECIDFLTAKAGDRGGIRSVVKHCERAYQLAQLDERTAVTVQDLQAASKMMGEAAMPVRGNGA